MSLLRSINNSIKFNIIKRRDTARAATIDFFSKG